MSVNERLTTCPRCGTKYITERQYPTKTVNEKGESVDSVYYEYECSQCGYEFDYKGRL